MEPASITKFHLENLDCANCAAKIERNLNKIDDFKSATVDFANLTLHVSTDDIDRVIQEVRRIDPTITIVPQSPRPVSRQPQALPTEYKPVKETIVLTIAALLFSLHLLLTHWLHVQTPLGLDLAVVVAAYLLAGWNVLWRAVRTVRSGAFFDENVLMMIATVGAIAIQAYSEAIGVMLFYKVGELLQERSVSRSRRSIKSLLAAKPDKAIVKTQQGFVEVAPEQVKVGQEVMVKPGEKVPLDGEITAGRSQLDTSALTGEFKPQQAAPGDPVMAGQINQQGALIIRVTRLFAESSIAKVMDLVENAAARKAKTEKFITTFARYYTPAVVCTAAAVAVIPPLFWGASFQTWIYRALVLLVISCPCALVVSIPLGYFGGIGRASRRGILVKGSNFIDALAALKTVVFDKTGTLTKGVFKLKQVVSLNGYSPEQLMEYAAAAEYHSNHPIANSILAAYSASGHQMDASNIAQHREITGEGVQTLYRGHSVVVGSDALLHRDNIKHDQCDFDATVAHVSVDGNYVGYILIGDELKDDAPEAIKRLRMEGVEQIVMLTGDNRCAAESIAHQLELDQFHAELLPEQKVIAFDKISDARKKLGKIAFVGDGINDAPVIARSDVGVAMGALGSDAAIETADIVLMTDSPLKMAEAVTIAKHTRRIIWQNISLAFCIKGIFLTLGAFGLASMWEAVFADMGTALLAVANSTRVLGKKTD